MGYERRTNPSLLLRDESAFVDHMLRDQPQRPANMIHIVAINQGRRPYAELEPTARPLGATAARELLESGHLAVDARSPEAFAREHVPGSLNVHVESQGFEQNVGWILPPDRPFVVVVDDDAAARRAAHKLAFVGLDRRAAGFVEISAWRSAGLGLQPMPTLDVAELRRAIDAGSRKVLDVREKGEWDAGHIAGAMHASFRHLPAALPELGLGKSEPVALICASGRRSATAYGILRGHGHQDVVSVAGGMNAWLAAGLPVLRAG